MDFKKHLDEYKERITVSKWLHDNEVKRYAFFNNLFNVSSIVITSLSASLSAITGQNTYNREFASVIGIINPIMLSVIATFNGIQHFFSLEKIVENHRTVSTKYLNLYNKIKETSLEDDQQSNEIKDFCKFVTTEFENIKNGAPHISTSSIQLLKKHNSKLVTYVANTVDSQSEIKIEIEDNKSKDNEVQIDTIKKFNLDRYMIHNFI